MVWPGSDEWRDRRSHLGVCDCTVPQGQSLRLPPVYSLKQNGAPVTDVLPTLLATHSPEGTVQYPTGTLVCVLLTSMDRRLALAEEGKPEGSLDHGEVTPWRRQTMAE